MTSNSTAPLEMLKAKAMLLLRREREVFELRQERARIELWLKVFQKLSLDLHAENSTDLFSAWPNLMVGDLNFQVAAVYSHNLEAWSCHL